MIRHYISTLIHKFWVLYYVCWFCFKLIKRALVHDFSKFGTIEAKIFSAHLKELKHTSIGTPEYNEMLQRVDIAIQHHYKCNRHHPDHWKNGIHDMNLCDVVEMFCDWRAAVRRNLDGNITKSIQYNEGRFNLDHQISEILQNQIGDDR